MLIDMSDNDMNEPETANLVFDDPVGYLAQFGIDSELLAETNLSAAA
jgi:hypothetical protein